MTSSSWIYYFMGICNPIYCICSRAEAHSGDRLFRMGGNNCLKIRRCGGSLTDVVAHLSDVVAYWWCRGPWIESGTFHNDPGALQSV